MLKRLIAWCERLRYARHLKKDAWYPGRKDITWHGRKIVPQKHPRGARAL